MRLNFETTATIVLSLGALIVISLIAFVLIQGKSPKSATSTKATVSTFNGGLLPSAPNAENPETNQEPANNSPTTPEPSIDCLDQLAVCQEVCVLADDLECQNSCDADFVTCSNS